MRKVFVDTNVLLDFLDEKRPLHTESKKFFQKCIEEDIAIGMSEDMLTTLFYIASKSIPKIKILQFFTVLQKYVSIHSFGNNGITESLEYGISHEKEDLEDILQAICAKQNGYEMMITNDKNFPVGILPVKSVQKVL